MRKPSFYALMIAKGLNIDTGEASLTEAVIRAAVPTLDHLSRRALLREARTAQAALAEMRRDEPEMVEWYAAQA